MTDPRAEVYRALWNQVEERLGGREIESEELLLLCEPLLDKSNLRAMVTHGVARARVEEDGPNIWFGASEALKILLGLVVCYRQYEIRNTADPRLTREVVIGVASHVAAIMAADGSERVFEHEYVQEAAARMVRYYLDDLAD